MCAEDQGPENEQHSRRKRKVRTVWRIISLTGGCIFVPVFVTAFEVGYLSWIGILVGIVYLAPGILSPLAGLAGRKRLEGFLTWLSVGMSILLPLAISVAAIWPVDDSEHWRPYRFDDELAALEAARAIPDQQNAAIRCRALFASLDVNDQPDFFFGGSRVREEFCENAWNGEEHPEAARWLDSCSWAVDELVRARGAGPFRWPLQADRYDDYTVPYKALRRSINLLIASANRDLGEGRLHDAIVKYSCSIGIAQDLRQQMQPVDILTGLGLESSALRMICHVSARHSLTDAEMAKITECLPPTNDRWHEMCERLFRLDKLQYMNLLARAYERDEQGHVRFAKWYRIGPENERMTEEDRDFGRWLRVYWPMNMPLDPKHLHRMADEHFAQFAYLLEPDGVPSVSRELGMSWSGMCKAAANFHRWFAEIVFFDGSEYGRIRDLQRAQVTRRRGTWLVLGLRRYQNEHGAWPSSLDEIFEYVPPETFLDPTSRSPFVYKQDDNSFRLYSTGPNRIDDGGRHRYVKALDKLEDDIAIWPPYVAEPPSQEEITEEFKAIYGEDYVRRFQTDTNTP